MAGSSDGTEESTGVGSDKGKAKENGKQVEVGVVEAPQGQDGADDREEEEDGDDDEEEDDEEDEEDEEPRLKYARLTGHITQVYRNGDATSTFLVAGDKMVLLALFPEHDRD
jgi:hypothetical protein